MGDTTNYAGSGDDYNHHDKGRCAMEWKLEVVPVPIASVSRAIRLVGDPI